MAGLKNAIPTAYKGINFRSRLEATWACFLDELNVDWKYEPLDLKGYIPDFVFDEGKTLLEVKPALTMHELWGAVEKIEASGWNGRSLIVGATFPMGRKWLGLGGADHGWGYAQIEHLNTGLSQGEVAWKVAQNTTQWMPGQAVKPTRGRRARPVESHADFLRRVEAAGREADAEARRIHGPMPNWRETTDPVALALAAHFEAIKRPSLKALVRTARNTRAEGNVLTFAMSEDWHVGSIEMYESEIISALKAIGVPGIRKVKAVLG